MTSIKELASHNFTSFTEVDQQIYATFLENASGMHSLTIADIAKLSFTSKSSILRFVNKLGFKGFSDFKYSVDWQADYRHTAEYHDSFAGKIAQIMTDLSSEQLATLADLISQAASLCLVATGEDQYIQMKNFSRMLLKKGFVCSQLQMNPNSEVTKLVLDRLNNDDLLLVFSAGGNSKLIKQYLVPSLASQVPIVSFTVNPNSWLEEISTLSFSLNLSPRDSTLMPYSSGLSHLLLNVIVEKLTSFL